MIIPHFQLVWILRSKISGCLSFPSLFSLLVSSQTQTSDFFVSDCGIAGYHRTSDLVFCYFYKNLDEKRNETMSLWQQCSPNTWCKYYWLNKYELHIQLCSGSRRLTKYLISTVQLLPNCWGFFTNFGACITIVQCFSSSILSWSFAKKR